MESSEPVVVEFVRYDPRNADTYPSVCPTSGDVEERFGFTGGEWLVFTDKGAYIGRLSHMLGEEVPPHG